VPARPADEAGMCGRARWTLSLALDGEAALGDVHLAVAHIGDCIRCQRVVADVVAFTRELRAQHVERPLIQTENGHSKGERS
jgi:predicted anti-sigma-YlaC factor YlaD